MSNQKYVVLRNGNKMPFVGLGTWKSKKGQVKAAVETAIDCGYRHVDCAWLYQNEAEIGKAIAVKMKEEVVSRDELFITSKLWNIFHDPEDVRFGFLETLNALNLEYLDLFLMHTPMGYKKINKKDHDKPDGVLTVSSQSPLIIMPRDENNFSIKDEVDYIETWKEMEKLVKEGLVKNIGVSNFNISQLKRLCSEAEIKPAVNQIEIHPYLSQTELVEFCHQNNIALTAYSPFASPDRPWRPENEKPLTSDPVLMKIAKKVDRSSHQVVLRYLIQRNISVTPKSVTPRNIINNIEVFDFKLSDEDMKEIQNLNKNFRCLQFEWDVRHKFYPFHESHNL